MDTFLSLHFLIMKASNIAAKSERCESSSNPKCSLAEGVNPTGNKANNESATEDKPIGGSQQRARPELIIQMAGEKGGMKTVNLGPVKEVKETDVETNTKTFGDRLVKVTSPGGGPQPARFGRFMRSPGSVSIENTSQSQLYNAPSARCQSREEVGNNTMVEGNLSGGHHSQFPSVSMTQESIVTDCDRCRKLATKINRENALKIRAARDATTAREHLEQLAMENQSMLKTTLQDLTKSRKEVDRLAKSCAQLAADNMHLKNVLKEMKMSFDKATF